MSISVLTHLGRQGRVDVIDVMYVAIDGVMEHVGGLVEEPTHTATRVMGGYHFHSDDGRGVRAADAHLFTAVDQQSVSRGY